MTRVLLTGGSGFVAGHVIDALLKRGHSVITTVRSQEKGEAIRTVHQDVPQSKLDFIIVPDIAANGSFSSIGSYGIQAVIHVASPFHFNVTDPKKDLIDPAVLGTTNVLKAVTELCPTVKRVVITSSFAAILDPQLASTGAKKTYTEADWSPVTLGDAYSGTLNAYIASKVLAEKAAWNFVVTERPNFTLCTLNPPMIYGPVNHPVKSLISVNTSSQLLAEVLAGNHKAGLPPTALPLWVDVRDVALAHVKAMELEEAGGKRFLITAGFYSNEEMGRTIWDNFPDLRDKLPDRNDMGGAPNPNLQSFGYDTSQARRFLGMEWTPYEKTVVDSVKSLITQN